MPLAQLHLALACDLGQLEANDEVLAELLRYEARHECVVCRSERLGRRGRDTRLEQDEGISVRRFLHAERGVLFGEKADGGAVGKVEVGDPDERVGHGFELDQDLFLVTPNVDAHLLLPISIVERAHLERVMGSGLEGAGQHDLAGSVSLLEAPLEAPPHVEKIEGSARWCGPHHDLAL